MLTFLSPQSVFLISPWNKLVSDSPTRQANAKFDYIDLDAAAWCALDYIGVSHPVGKSPVWNPLHILSAKAPPFDAHFLPAKGLKATHAGNEGTGVDLLMSPYVNPSVCDDLDWWKEACPGGGRTMISWGEAFSRAQSFEKIKLTVLHSVGGIEAMCDDVVEFVERLELAGVAPRRLCKPLAAHDWNLYDEVSLNF